LNKKQLVYVIKLSGDTFQTSTKVYHVLKKTSSILTVTQMSSCKIFI